MFSYTFDEETGGLLLNSSPTNFSKEPRPVYAKELDILGFDEYWDYKKQNETPYMWAESNAYWYRGSKIASIKGGSLYIRPELKPVIDEDGKVPLDKATGAELLPIDIAGMCEKNRKFVELIESVTVKKIVREYEEFNKRVDVFHVAFSAGKDSAVLLHLVKKALPLGSYTVVFGDTGMEFPDTYDSVAETQALCEKEGIPFYIAKSDFGAEESWELFGPPSKTLRWCCSVHKSAPQVLKLREVTGKDDYTGLDFIGVRQHESLARSTYTYENYGKKQQGQYSYSPILEWTSAEVWLYIFMNGIAINKAYTKGNARVGCLFCPMTGETSVYMRRQNYPEQVDNFVRIVQNSDGWDSHSEKDLQTYVTSGGWLNRRSGRGIKGNEQKYKETKDNSKVRFELVNPNSDWREWLKTVDTKHLPYSVEQTSEGCVFEVDQQCFRKYPSEGRFLRQALKKAAYCVSCRVCEANCKKGHLKFASGHPIITDCEQCHECHDIPAGCHAYNSLKIPQGEKKMKSINCFEDHAPKEDWLISFFDLQDDFFDNNQLGPNQLAHFKRFLRDAKLIEKNECTDFSDLICTLGWDTDVSLGLILVNLAYENPQFGWYIEEMDVGVYYTYDEMRERLLALDLKIKAANSILASFKRIVATSLGTTLNFGLVDGKKMARTKCRMSDDRVFLYALYSFAKKCNLDKEFHLSYLYDESVERDGVSPIRIFGFNDKEELKSILLGLSARFPEFINAAFTNDLETITLRDKGSNDVLKLFKEDL